MCVEFFSSWMNLMMSSNIKKEVSIQRQIVECTWNGITFEFLISLDIVVDYIMKIIMMIKIIYNEKLCCKHNFKSLQAQIKRNKNRFKK